MPANAPLARSPQHQPPVVEATVTHVYRIEHRVTVEDADTGAWLLALKLMVAAWLACVIVAAVLIGVHLAG